MHSITQKALWEVFDTLCAYKAKLECKHEKETEPDPARILRGEIYAINDDLQLLREFIRDNK